MINESQPSPGVLREFENGV